MIRDRIVIFLGEFVHSEKESLGELLDFCGLCIGFFLFAALVTL